VKTIIGLTGQARSGKDTVARAIIQYDSSFVKYAMADPVRDAVKAFFGWDDSAFVGNKKETIDEFWGISPRQALQYVGTEVGRQGFAAAYPYFNEKTGDQLWIKRFQKFAESLSDTNNIVISDIRFLNEQDSILSLDRTKYNVITVGILRYGADSDGHASESEVIECVKRSDYIFQNNGTLSDIEYFVENLLKRDI